MTISEIIQTGGATIDKNGVAVTLKTGWQVSIKDLHIISISTFKKKGAQIL